ncbi:hypothetical protein ACP4OV_005721 [Aristida adscensionis]
MLGGRMAQLDRPPGARRRSAGFPRRGLSSQRGRLPPRGGLPSRCADGDDDQSVRLRGLLWIPFPRLSSFAPCSDSSMRRTRFAAALLHLLQ